MTETEKTATQAYEWAMVSVLAISCV